MCSLFVIVERKGETYESLGADRVSVRQRCHDGRMGKRCADTGSNFVYKMMEDFNLVAIEERRGRHLFGRFVYCVLDGRLVGQLHERDEQGHPE